MSEILLGAGPFLGAIMLPLLSGMLTLGLITGNQRISAGFALALGYALGIGILGQLMLLMGWLDLPLNKNTISLAVFIYISVISFLFLLRLYYFPPVVRHCEERFSATKQSLTWAHKLFFAIMLAYVLYQICFIFWDAFFVPIYQADAFSVYAYKAKMFFYTHNLRQPSELYLSGKSLSYPLQALLVITWEAFNIGQWHEGWAQVTVSLNCLAFIVIIYNCMKFWTNTLASLLTTALMLSSLFFVLHASIVYGDFTVMFYTIVALLLMGRGIYGRSLSFIILGGLMSAFAASVKLEGIGYWMLGVIILCRFIFDREFFNFRFVSMALAGFISPFIMVETNFDLFKAHYKIIEIWDKGHYFIFPAQQFTARILKMVQALSDNLFLSGNWNILWFFLIIMALINWKQKKPFAVKFFSFALIMFFVNYFMAVEFTRTAIYIANPENLDSLSRLLLHFFPLCPVLIGLLMHNFFKIRRLQIAPH
jgi:hypothetical protein